MRFRGLMRWLLEQRRSQPRLRCCLRLMVGWRQGLFVLVLS